MEITTIYEKIGGDASIRKIVDTFYPKVYENEELSPLFEGDIDEIKRKQWMFLTQLTGGGALYSEEFGPPNMRARHMPFEITPVRAQTWLKLMQETLTETGLIKTEGGKALFERLSQIAPIMINRP
ncbi:globin [Mesobacillus subterraneus]|uniref:Globin n=1 Tax=Mesobacillus subterraneus TaxID=285983 RepID=A0A3R9F0C8_9BACI|nr:globin [Mesobacillus subterraneus]RSD27147.1 globin [Mesobacillus subterraneus]